MKNQPSLLSEQLDIFKLKYVADQYGPWPTRRFASYGTIENTCAD